MAVTATIVPGPNGSTQHPHPSGAWAKVYDLAFSGNYQDDQSESTLDATDVGYSVIHEVIPHTPMAPASGFATANEYAVSVADDGSNAVFAFYENAAAGSPSAEKTDNEAFLSGQEVRVTVVGH